MKKVWQSVLIICILILPTFSFVFAQKVDPTQISIALKPGESSQFNFNVETGDVPIPKIDVIFAIDRTGSMADEISVVQSDAISIMNDIRSKVSDSNFGVVSFMDYPGNYSYPGYSAIYGSGIDVPYVANIQPTSDMTSVSSVINGLTIGYGDDMPEDYTRVLYESMSLDWRPLTKKIVILFGDAPTHDLDFAGYNFGGDPGRNTISTADDLDFETVVNEVQQEGITVLAVQGSEVEPYRTYAEATFKGMSIGFAGASGTNGQYFQLSNANQIPKAVSDMVSVAVSQIKHLTLQIPAEYQNWFSYSPSEFTDVGPHSSNTFSITVTVPEGSSGSGSIMIQALGDGVLLGSCEVSIAILPTANTNDLRFRPSSDGYSFRNFGGTYSWDMFRQFFGAENTNHANGDTIYAAEQFFNSEYKYFKGGLCDGFSVSSMINFLELSQPNAGKFAIPLTYSPFNSATQDAFTNTIEYYQGYQKGYEMAMLESMRDKSDPNSYYALIKSNIQMGIPIVIGVYYPLGGHSLLPYRFEEEGSDIARVYVYDSRDPGDNGSGWPFYSRAITFNLKDDTYQYISGSVPEFNLINFEGSKTHPNMSMFPLSMYLNKGIPIWNVPDALKPPDYISVSGGAEVMLTDTSGNQAGFMNGIFTSEIQGVADMRPVVSSDTVLMDEDLYVPGDCQYSTTLNGINHGSYNLNAFTNNFLVQILNATVSSSTVDNLKFGSANPSMTYSTNDGNKSYSAVLDKETASSSRVFIVGTSISSGDNTTISLTSNQDLKYTNLGGSKIYDLEILQKGQGAGDLVIANISIAAGDTEFVKVNDWNSLATTPIILETDKGSDGTIDQTKILANGPPNHTISASAGEGGSISPSGIVSVNFGDNQAFNIALNNGYHVTNVMVDGSSVGAVSSYLFSNVTASHTITSSFAINSYPITIVHGSNGLIAGPSSVNYGSDSIYSIVASSGYHIVDVVVDSVSKGVVASYIISNVQASHTISATFEPDPTNTPTPAPTSNPSPTPTSSPNATPSINPTQTTTPIPSSAATSLPSSSPSQTESPGPSQPYIASPSPQTTPTKLTVETPLFLYLVGVGVLFTAIVVSALIIRRRR